MFRSFKTKVGGSILRDPGSTDGSSRSTRPSSPSRWSLPSGGSSTAGGDTGHASSFHDIYPLGVEGLARSSASQATSPSTSHLMPEGFIIDRSPQPSMPPTAPAAEDTQRTSDDIHHQQADDAPRAPTWRYVIDVDGVPIPIMFATSNDDLPPSYDANPNPSFVRAFNRDDLDPPPLYDWNISVGSQGSEDQRPSRLQEGNWEEQPSPPQSHVPRRAFSYGTISADIMAGFDFPPPAAKAVATLTETDISSSSSRQRQRGYLPTAASILEDFNMSPFSPQTTGGSNSTAASTPPVSSPFMRPKLTSHSLGSNNPYAALLEQKEQAMTVAFLRSQDAMAGSRSTDVPADDFSFGQRYQKAADTTDVVVTRQRLPANDLGGSRECPICAETKEPSGFPVLSVTSTCSHPPEACLECLQTSIKSDLNSKLWTEIRCPECRELLEYVDIQKYADDETFARYETLALRAAMAEADNFIWCTANCGSGQLHSTSRDQPIVTCLHCGQRSCFTHNVTWHENLTCEEYDALLRDPENFRSRIEMNNDEVDTAKRAQEDADRAMAQGLMAEQQAEILFRVQREAAEKERARRAVALARKVAARRKAEEEQSQATMSRTTKPCPGCGWAIEKNAGCSHMTCKYTQMQHWLFQAPTLFHIYLSLCHNVPFFFCQTHANNVAGIKCRYEFCWGCYTAWKGGHSVRCRGVVTA
ncbi:ring finger domain-containing protein [Colletotrichum truncatum]|uniref:Ring finger domain-containing protein n=1 Tax=Colletotrichum truncatum TaxID=5467 RepID=A0ACC3ZBD0_COLTU|nr:ring finger domain-containing protein [Colletotrichum truncatum]KAF6787714.1 ring finger domain-containing protein [Colletotrichum truncatum]